MLASLVVLIVQLLLSDAELKAWGWRIPFFIGAIFAVVAFFLRRSLTETSSAETRSRKEAGSLREIFTHHTRAFLIVLGYTAGGSLIFYTFTTYMQKYLVNTAHMNDRTAQRGDDRGAVHLHDHAAAVRRVFRPHRPQDIDAAVRRPRDALHGAADVRDRRRQEPLSRRMA